MLKGHIYCRRPFSSKVFSHKILRLLHQLIVTSWLIANSTRVICSPAVLNSSWLIVNGRSLIYSPVALKFCAKQYFQAIFTIGSTRRPYSSPTFTKRHKNFMRIQAIMPKHVKGMDILDSPPNFLMHIEMAKQEKLRRQMCGNMPIISNEFKYVVNSDPTASPVYYKVFIGSVQNISNILPKQGYRFVIADVPYGFLLSNSINDEKAFTYKQVSKMIQEFKLLTTSPFWKFLIFHSAAQAVSVIAFLKERTHGTESLIWYNDIVCSET